jgi:hypothetical protein
MFTRVQEQNSACDATQYTGGGEAPKAFFVPLQIV